MTSFLNFLELLFFILEKELDCCDIKSKFSQINLKRHRSTTFLPKPRMSGPTKKKMPYVGAGFSYGKTGNYCRCFSCRLDAEIGAVLIVLNISSLKQNKDFSLLVTALDLRCYQLAQLEVKKCDLSTLNMMNETFFHSPFKVFEGFSPLKHVLRALSQTDMCITSNGSVIHCIEHMNAISAAPANSLSKKQCAAFYKWQISL